jgi:hypothetical protein
VSDRPEWRRWREHRARRAMARWGVRAFLAGGLFGDTVLHMPEPAWFGVLAAVLVMAWWALLHTARHVGDAPPGWPGYRCIVCAAEGSPRCYDCLEAHRLEERIRLGVEYPYKAQEPILIDPSLW